MQEFEQELSELMGIEAHFLYYCFNMYWWIYAAKFWFPDSDEATEEQPKPLMGAKKIISGISKIKWRRDGGKGKEPAGKRSGSTEEESGGLRGRDVKVDAELLFDCESTESEWWVKCSLDVLFCFLGDCSYLNRLQNQAFRFLVHLLPPMPLNHLMWSVERVSSSLEMHSRQPSEP